MKESDNINILAVDQARHGAWSVFNYEEKKLITYGTFSFENEKYTYAQATVAIEDLIASVIKEHHISAVFLEDIQLRFNVDSFKKLAMLQGVLAASFERSEYLYDFVSPSKWQNYCMVRTRTAKEKKVNIKALDQEGKKQSKVLSLQFVKDRFDINTDNDNLSDAVCMGWYIVNHYNFYKVN